MNIYMITRRTPSAKYDVYEGAVVYAKDAQSARNMHPADGRALDHHKRSGISRGAWETDPKQVVAKLIGEAPTRNTAGVIMTDFSAG